MSNRVANTVMLSVAEYEALLSEAADACSLRKKYADLCMAQSVLPEGKALVEIDSFGMRCAREILSAQSPRQPEGKALVAELRQSLDEAVDAILQINGILRRYAKDDAPQSPLGTIKEKP